MAPASGVTEGGTSVVLAGVGFAGASAVMFGGVPAARYRIDSPDQITAISPSHFANDQVEISVVSGGLSSAHVIPDAGALFIYTGNPAGCDRPLATDHVVYGAGYSLVGLPAGASVPADSPLYGWFNLGSGNHYTTADPTETRTDGGRGYWAYFACPRSVSLPATGMDPTTLPLAASHASMIGNPYGGSPALVTGYDFAARWDPAINGYRVSGYRQEQSLSIGEGMWVFSYVSTSIVIRPTH
jgi:hypothetical protein